MNNGLIVDTMKIYIALAVLLVVLTACSPEVSNVQKSTMERYADFEAELGCKMFEAGVGEDGDMVMKILAETPAIAEKHGFTANDVVELTEQYHEDDEFMNLVMGKMQKDCPEVIELMEEQANS